MILLITPSSIPSLRTVIVFSLALGRLVFASLEPPPPGVIVDEDLQDLNGFDVETRKLLEEFYKDDDGEWESEYDVISDSSRRYTSIRVLEGATAAATSGGSSRPLPGEMGKPVKIENPTEEEQKLIDEGYKRHAFNEYVSDQISLHRSLPDMRNHWCRRPGLHVEPLLEASVILCFHNEALSVLLRSMHSILDRTPEHLLKEIVLVDDFSELENLKDKLEAYVKDFPKVKLVRSKERLGLIRARMMGAANAQGPVLVFLDSHIEVTKGWLEPMSDRITRNKTTVVCPIIDVIDDNTLEYKLQERAVTAVGGFTWDMIFTWKTASDEVLRSLKTPADPVPSPTMAGGLFAIHKEFFDRIGQYDDEYEIWGAENLELSFKTWMCGGRLEFVPCSHIGHIYRKRAPYTRNGADQRPYKNYMRLAAVWLDEYAKYYFRKIGKSHLNDVGDISKRIELRKGLKCESFDWFIKNVYPDVFNPKLAAGEGEIRNEAFGGHHCLDAFSQTTTDPKPVSLIWPCHNHGGNQHWFYTQTGELRRDEKCLDYNGGDSLKLFHCHGGQGNQMWLYDIDNGFIIHMPSLKCLTLDTRTHVSLTTCEERITQRWKLEKVNRKRVTTVWNRWQEIQQQQPHDSTPLPAEPEHIEKEEEAETS